MKNLLLVIFLMLGSICQAQKVEINGYVYFEKTPETYLSKRIDSLEKRIASLEKMVKVLYDKHIQDSLYYQRLVHPFNWTPQTDSIEAWPKDYYMIPLLNNKRKSR